MQSSLYIDKDEKFEFYTIPALDGLVFFLPKLPNEGTRNVEDYVRLNQGDWWIYGDGFGNRVGLEIDGTKKINGIDVPIMKDTQGNKTYQGFKGVFLNVFGNVFNYGGNDIELLYDPIVHFGDDRLGMNKLFSNNVRDRNTGIYFDLDYLWRTIDGVTTNYGRFDSCWRVEEKSDDQHITRWFARNVGQVKISYNNSELNLIDYGSGGLPSGISSSKMSRKNSRLLMSPFRQHL